MYVLMYVCMHACMYVCMNTYIHTYIHLNLCSPKGGTKPQPLASHLQISPTPT